MPKNSNYRIVVGLDATPLIKVKGGVGFYVKEIISKLINLDTEILFLFFSPINSEELKFFDKFSNVKIIINNKFSFSEALWSQTTLAFLLTKYSVDVFWGTTQSVPIIKNKKIMTILTIHDFTYILYPQTMSTVRRLYLKIFSNIMIKSANRIIVNSAATGDKLIKYYQRSSDIILRPPVRSTIKLDKNTVIKILNLSNCEYKNYCLCVASLEPRKNLVSLINNYSSLLDDGQNLIPLVIIGGNGWKNNEIKKTIEKNLDKYPSKIIFLDFVDEVIYSVYISSAKLLVMPSIYEGYGMPIAEARKAGTPILATDIPEHREAAENDGNFFPLCEMTSALSKFLDVNYDYEITKMPSYYSSVRLASILLDEIDSLYLRK